jgi:2,4-dienoyl-CoA reductase-like NADH-dependent reductase (Old Yellow Enzyme family)
MDMPPLDPGGQIRSCGVAEKIVEDGSVDSPSMNHRFIREPDLIVRRKAGDGR